MPIVLRSSVTRRALLGGAVWTAVTTQGAHAQEGTPDRPPPVPLQATPTGDEAAGSVFAEMLALAPDVLVQPERPLQIAQFGDIAAQLAVLGLEPMPAGGTLAYDWARFTGGILRPLPLASGLEPAFRELFGFDAFLVDQSLVVGEPPAEITLLRGRFDETTLRSAWTGAGYQELDEGGATVFSVTNAPEPVFQLAGNSFNNAAILADGTVVFAATLDLMREALAVAAGQAPSLAESDQVAAVLTTIDQPLASAIILDGAALEFGVLLDDPRWSPEVVAEVQEELEQSGKMPPPQLSLLGFTPGGPFPPPPSEPEATPIALDNQAIWVTRLLMADSAAAELAAQTIPRRIETLAGLPESLDPAASRRPYAELVSVRRAEAVSDPSVVMLDLDGVEGKAIPQIWNDLVYSRRDLLFLAS